MSPALQKLRKELDQAKARYLNQPPQPVGMDVIENLYAALVAQDAEIRKLKGEQDSDRATPDAAASVQNLLPASHTDSYVGPTEGSINSPVYNLKSLKPPHPAQE